MDPSSLCSSQGVTRSEAGLGNGVFNQGGNGLPLNCSGIDQPMQSWGSQLPTPELHLFPPDSFSSDEVFNLGGNGLPLNCSGIDQPMQSCGLQLPTPELHLFPPESFSSDEVFNLGGNGLPLNCSGIDQPMQSCGLQLPTPELHLFPPESFSSDEVFNLGGNGLPLNCSGIDQPMQSCGLQLPTPELHLFPPESFSSDEVFNQGGNGLPLNCSGTDQPMQSCGSQLPTPELHLFPPESFSGGHSTLSPVGNDSNLFVEMSDDINVIESQTPKVKSKCTKKSTSLVWKYYKIITEKDGKERAQCIKCRAKYVIDSRKIGTSTLRRHLEKCSRNETHDVGQLEPKDQGPEPIQEENIIEERTPERPCVPQVHNSPAVQSGTTLSSPASGVLGTTPAVTAKRRRLAFRPTSHDSANKSAGTEADEGKSSTPPAATEEEVQASRDLQLSLATTKSGPQEESGSVHKQFASAEESRSIGEHNEELENEAKGSWTARGKQMQLFMEETQKHKEIILPSLYQLDVLVGPRLRRELDEEIALLKEEISSFFAKLNWMRLYVEKNLENKERILFAQDQHKDLDECDEELELENEEQSPCVNGFRQILLDIDKRMEHKKIIFREAIDRQKGILARAASKLDRLKTFVSRVEGTLE